VLLAGGAGSRFGALPKGLARVDGERIADRALRVLAAVTDRQCVVANDVAAAGWFPGLRIVADDVAGLGPLAGLATALRAGDGDAVLVVAWDMPFVSVELLRALRAQGEGAGVSVVPVHGPHATLEPLCAYYRAGAAPLVERLLRAGERRGRALHDALLPTCVTVLRAEALGGMRATDHLFTSVDTVEALEALGGTMPAGDMRPPTRR